MTTIMTAITIRITAKIYLRSPKASFKDDFILPGVLLTGDVIDVVSVRKVDISPDGDTGLFVVKIVLCIFIKKYRKE